MHFHTHLFPSGIWNHPSGYLNPLVPVYPHYSAKPQPTKFFTQHSPKGHVVCDYVTEFLSGWTKRTDVVLDKSQFSKVQSALRECLRTCVCVCDLFSDSCGGQVPPKSKHKKFQLLGHFPCPQKVQCHFNYL